MVKMHSVNITSNKVLNAPSPAGLFCMCRDILVTGGPAQKTERPTEQSNIYVTSPLIECFHSVKDGFRVSNQP